MLIREIPTKGEYDMDDMRYYYEHQAIPNLLNSDCCKQFLGNLLCEKEQFLVELYYIVHRGYDDYKCPYDVSEFDVTPLVFDGMDKAAIRISFPPPEGPGLCGRAYICHDENFENLRYYTLEADHNRKLSIGEWTIEGELIVHKNHGEAPIEQQAEWYKIIGLYIEYLNSNLHEGI